MLSNMKLKTEDNLDYLDGYEELPSELQEKVARAFEQGHVDDGDWKGVSALPGSPRWILTSVRIFRRTVWALKAFGLQHQKKERKLKMALGETMKSQ